LNHLLRDAVPRDFGARRFLSVPQPWDQSIAHFKEPAPVRASRACSPQGRLLLIATFSQARMEAKWKFKKWEQRR
jgi:hypothetical protein